MATAACGAATRVEEDVFVRSSPYLSVLQWRPPDLRSTYIRHTYIRHTDASLASRVAHHCVDQLTHRLLSTSFHLDTNIKHLLAAASPIRLCTAASSCVATAEAQERGTVPGHDHLSATS